MSTPKRELLVVGNWKMNPPTIAAAKRLFLDIHKRLGTRPTSVRVVIAPPFPFIGGLSELSPSKRIALGAQGVYFESEGAHTGEVSISMLKSVGASYVIIGHSESRARGETDLDIYKDTQQVLGHRVNAIVCVGETERDKAGNYFTVIETQLRAALRDIEKAQLQYLSIAYEPVWAIGTGNTATARDAEEMKLFIQKILADECGRAAVGKVRILYGGSVDPDNALDLLSGGIDGFLVGGASLRARDFASIISTARAHARSHAA